MIFTLDHGGRWRILRLHRNDEGVWMRMACFHKQTVPVLQSEVVSREVSIMVLVFPVVKSLKKHIMILMMHCPRWESTTSITLTKRFINYGWGQYLEWWNLGSAPWTALTQPFKVQSLPGPRRRQTRVELTVCEYIYIYCLSRLYRTAAKGNLSKETMGRHDGL